jgi:site-specific DNA recombinase
MSASTAALSRPSTSLVRGSAVYCRISRDRTGAGLGVERQAEDARKAIEALGLPAEVAVYTDNDLSAYSGKARPGYQAMLADMADGRFSHLVAWHTDRLHRAPAELESFIEAVEQAGVQVQTVKAGHLDLATPSGRMVARLLGATARYESEHKSARITRKHEELAMAGKSHGGRRRFGYEAGMAEVRESEAAVVREVAGRLLSGETLHSIARDLGQRGVVGASGAAFTGPNLRAMMLRPHLVALRVHRGEVVGAAEWPAILDRQTWDAVGTLLTNPARRTTTTNARRWLLSGIARCAECGGPLRGRTQGTKGLRPTYLCPNGVHVARDQASTDEVVIAAVAHRLAMVDAAGMLADQAEDPTEALRARADLLRGNLAAMAVDKVLGKITPAEHQAATEAVRAEVAALEARIADAAVSARQPQAVLADLVDVAEHAARARFLDLPLGRQRQVLAALGAEVVVHKAGHKGSRFDAEAVAVNWTV